LTVALPHGGARPWSGRLTLDADGLRVSPKRVDFRNVRPGGQPSAVFEVEVPVGTPTPGLRHLTARANVSGVDIPSAAATLAVFSLGEVSPLEATGGRGNTIRLGWQSADAGRGLASYRVYGSTDPSFKPGPATLLGQV